MVRHDLIREVSGERGSNTEFSVTDKLIIEKFPLLEKGQVYMVVESDPYQLVLQKLEKVIVTNNRQIVLPDGVFVDFSTYKVTKDGISVYLTKKLWKILECLVRHNGRAVSIETLCKEVWDDDYDVEEPHLLRVQISRLRSALSYNCIETIPGIGYRLCLK